MFVSMMAILGAVCASYIDESKVYVAANPFTQGIDNFKVIAGFYFILILFQNRYNI